MIPVISANKRAKRGTTYTFNQADGALSGWDYTNSAWTVASNRAIATPTLGAELFANGTFAADTNWTKGTGWTIGSGVATHASGTASNITQAVLSVGSWYRYSWDYSKTSGLNFAAYFGLNSTSLGQGPNRTASGSYIDTGRCFSTTAGGVRAQNTAVGTLDNFSGKQITASDMLASKSFTSISVTTTASVLVSAGKQVGIVTNLDSASSPANYIMFYLDGTNAILEKCVGGTYTTIATTALAVTGENSLQVVTTRSGGNLLIDTLCNGAVVGTQQTITDAGIIDNTRHGIIASDPTVSVSRFVIVQR
jgi:hypothetical protein